MSAKAIRSGSTPDGFFEPVTGGVSRRFYRCRFIDSCVGRWLFFSACVSLMAVLAILGFLVYFSFPLVKGGQLSQVLAWHWRPFHGQFGILPMVVGSLAVSFCALLVAYPLGLGICCFSHGLASPILARFVMAIIHFMTSIPTVVYGFVSVFMLVPIIRDCFSGGTGFSWLAAFITLSIMVLPTIVLLIHSQFQQVHPDVHLASVALGLNPYQELLWIVLPASRRGLLAAAILGFGRAVGDTIIPLMVAGNAPQIPSSLLDSIRTLTAHIALVVSTDSRSAAYQSLFACGLILFAVAAAVNLTLRWIESRPISVETYNLT